MRTMALNSVTLLVSQASSELKASALLNVPAIVDTLLVSHASGWLNFLASSNIHRMVFTLLVSHASGWSKASAM